jgi:hypothetical protein
MSGVTRKIVGPVVYGPLGGTVELPEGYAGKVEAEAETGAIVEVDHERHVEAVLEIMDKQGHWQVAPGGHIPLHVRPVYENYRVPAVFRIALYGQGVPVESARSE